MRCFAPFLLCATTLAQTSHYTAYSTDSLHGAYGHWAFFGVLSTGGSDECRAQQLVPAAFMPATAGLITGVEVPPHFTGTITYQRLDLQLGACPTTTLTTDMDANLPVPTTVYSATPGTSISWPSATQWTRVNFTTPFLYVPGTDLVFESRRVIQRPATASITVSHQHSNGPSRNDLPHPVWAEGGPGSGRANQQFGSTYGGPHMLIRFVFSGVPTLTISGPRVSGTQYKLGQSLTITAQGNPGEAYAHAIDLLLAATPAPFPPVQGLLFLTPALVLTGIGPLDPSGLGAQTIPIPSTPSLAGVHLYFQSATGSTIFGFTNAVDAILQP
ncbi:MAG TPA: hypothetical protein VK348_06345 [Planctomycetota bacterium]|nr:hypothetical protein [Planctomycetota bacterium]